MIARAGIYRRLFWLSRFTAHACINDRIQVATNHCVVLLLCMRCSSARGIRLVVTLDGFDAESSSKFFFSIVCLVSAAYISFWRYGNAILYGTFTVDVFFKSDC